MKQELNKSLIWNEAAKAGLVLGLIPVIYMLINQLVGKIGGAAVLTSILSMVLWAVKFGLCLWLMRVFMLKFAAKYAVTNADTFKFGTIAALCSALIVAVFDLANVLFISPDLYTQQFDAIIGSYSSMMDSNSMQAIEKIEDSLPQITFFSNFIYCFVFGLILSLIYSRNIPSRDPFAGFETPQDDQTDNQSDNADE